MGPKTGSARARSRRTLAVRQPTQRGEIALEAVEDPTAGLVAEQPGRRKGDRVVHPDLELSAATSSSSVVLCLITLCRRAIQQPRRVVPRLWGAGDEVLRGESSPTAPEDHADAEDQHRQRAAHERTYTDPSDPRIDERWT